MKAKFALTILIILPVATNVLPQTMMNENGILEKYQAMEKQTRPDAGQIKKYNTPQIFSDGDSANFERSGTNKAKAYANKVNQSNDGASGNLKLFGYNMFDTAPGSFSPIMESTPPPDYKLGPGDKVLINVWGRVDMQLNLTVDREGKIFIPKVGEIIAWGLAIDNFEERVRKAMSKIYSDFQLSVSLGKIKQIKVFVYGELKKPGGYTTSSLSTLFNALYLAGGPSSTGSLRKIKHIRNNKVLKVIDLYRFLLEGDNSDDSRLESGDVIFVPVVGPVVSISGQVKRPAKYELLGGENLQGILDIAGGATAEAFLESIDIDRIGENDNRIIKNVDLTHKELDSDVIRVRDGDRIYVPSMFSARKNTVILSGHIKHPGVFGLTDSMRIIDLLDTGEQLISDSYLKRANLFRTWPDLTREILTVNIDAVLKGEMSTNYRLQEKDSLVVYSQGQIKRAMTVTISGTIKRPGRYEYFSNMRLSDLIFLAGNPLKQTYALRAEIARLNPGKPANVFFVNLDEALINKGGDADPLLKEDDNIYIRKIPGWREIENVTIEGEVKFPGAYAVTEENKTLYDLIRKSGGFTKDAFIEGIVFNRGSISDNIEKSQLRSILLSTEETILDSLNRPIPKINTALDLSRVNRIVIDIKKLLNDPGAPDNIVLRNGDYIFVPEAPSGIQVLGAVASSGTMTFKAKQKPEYFINKAGGYTSNANKKEMRLVKANGRIYSRRKGFKRKVEPGDIIMVPFKINKERTWLKNTVSIAGIIASIATTAIIMNRL